MSINGTLIAQMIVFLILVWFTMKFVWPPIVAALDERAEKIKAGLSAADKAKADLAQANQKVEAQLTAARTDAQKRLADAERLAQQMVEEAKGRAAEEGAKIIAAAKAEAEQEAMASEHSARMVAMRNASENAKDLSNDLTLTLNKARQAQITREVSEIAAGAEALKG